MKVDSDRSKSHRKTERQNTVSMDVHLLKGNNNNDLLLEFSACILPR